MTVNNSGRDLKHTFLANWTCFYFLSTPFGYQVVWGCLTLPHGSLVSRCWSSIFTSIDSPFMRCGVRIIPLDHFECHGLGWVISIMLHIGAKWKSKANYLYELKVNITCNTDIIIYILWYICIYTKVYLKPRGTQRVLCTFNSLFLPAKPIWLATKQTFYSELLSVLLVTPWDFELLYN